MSAPLILDDGLQFGLGVFETIAGTWPRGAAGKSPGPPGPVPAAALGLGELPARGVTREAVSGYIRAHCPPHSACKLILTQENLILQNRPNPYGPERYDRGFVMDFSAVVRNDTSPLVGHKTMNYGDCILEHRAAAAAGMDERIFLNTRGQLAEGTVSNLFLVSGGRLYTPALSCGLLPGVLRDYLCRSQTVEETELYPRQLGEFQECFVTNSLMGIMPVRKLGERIFPSRETADRLRAEYERDIKFL